MWSYFILSIIIVFSWLAYVFYFRPKKMIAYYKKTFESLGYRVYELPFKFLDAPELRIRKKDEI